MAAAFCGSCGAKLAGTFCSICGSAAAGAQNASTSSSGPGSGGLGPNARSFFDSVFKPRPAGNGSSYDADAIQQAPGNTISPEILRQWNWGAFLLPVLWPFWHGMEVLGIIMVICLLPFLWPVGFAIAIYLGLKGSQLAAQGRVYGNDANFLRVERAWAMWAIISVLAVVVLNIVGMFFSFVGSILSSAR